VEKSIVLSVSGKSPNAGRLVSSTNTQKPQVTLVHSAGYRRSKQMSCLKRLSKGSSHSHHHWTRFSKSFGQSLSKIWTFITFWV